MFLGVMPTERMGRQYNVMEYITLGQAVILGDLKGFEEVCNLMLQDFFLLWKLSLLLYRHYGNIKSYSYIAVCISSLSK